MLTTQLSPSHKQEDRNGIPIKQGNRDLNHHILSPWTVPVAFPGEEDHIGVWVEEGNEYARRHVEGEKVLRARQLPGSKDGKEEEGGDQDELLTLYPAIWAVGICRLQSQWWGLGAPQPTPPDGEIYQEDFNRIGESGEGYNAMAIKCMWWILLFSCPDCLIGKRMACLSRRCSIRQRSAESYLLPCVFVCFYVENYFPDNHVHVADHGLRLY